MTEYSRVAECPSTEEICSVAVGLASEQEAEALLTHAADCASCAAILARAAVDLHRELDPREQALLESLAAAPAKGPALVRTRRPKVWIAAAAAAVVILSVASLVWMAMQGRQASGEKLLAAASSRYRVNPWRMPDAGYSPIQQTRGGEPGSVPAELLQVEASLDGAAERDALLRAWTALVRGRYAAALETLGTVRPSGAEEEYRFHILRGIAKGGGGEAAALRGALADFTRALELRPSDAAARFDRALAHWNLGEVEAARADLALLCEDAAQSAWCAEARSWMAPAPGQ